MALAFVASGCRVSASANANLNTGKKSEEFEDGPPVQGQDQADQLPSEYALLGARHDLSLAADKRSAACSCLAVSLGATSLDVSEKARAALMERKGRMAPGDLLRMLTGVAELELRVDERPLSREALGRTFHIAPGEHLVEARGVVGGRRALARQTVVVAPSHSTAAGRYRRARTDHGSAAPAYQRAQSGTGRVRRTTSPSRPSVPSDPTSTRQRS